MAGFTEQDLEPQADRDVVTTRILDAPRERVFRAWTDPDLLARWWGPEGFTNSFQVFDLKPGNYTVRLVARDTESQHLGAQSSSVVIR